MSKRISGCHALALAASRHCSRHISGQPGGAQDIISVGIRAVRRIMQIDAGAAAGMGRARAGLRRAPARA